MRTMEKVAKALRGEVMVKMGILKAISARGKIKVFSEFIHDVIDGGEKLIVFAYLKEVVQELKADRFRKLVEERKTTALKQKYENLEKNYKTAKESEFYIVFAGVYSSGKSTLLNTLIRHDVLPTSSVTCTSKNCRIKHNRTLGSKVSLTGYDDKMVLCFRNVFLKAIKIAQMHF